MQPLIFKIIQIFYAISVVLGAIIAPLVQKLAPPVLIMLLGNLILNKILDLSIIIIFSIIFRRLKL